MLAAKKCHLHVFVSTSQHCCVNIQDIWLLCIPDQFDVDSMGSQAMTDQAAETDEAGGNGDGQETKETVEVETTETVLNGDTDDLGDIDSLAGELELITPDYYNL